MKQNMSNYLKRKLHIQQRNLQQDVKEVQMVEMMWKKRNHPKLKKVMPLHIDPSNYLILQNIQQYVVSLTKTFLQNPLSDAHLSTSHERLGAQIFKINEVFYEKYEKYENITDEESEEEEEEDAE